MEIEAGFRPIAYLYDHRDDYVGFMHMSTAGLVRWIMDLVNLSPTNVIRRLAPSEQRSSGAEHRNVDSESQRAAHSRVQYH